MNSLAKGFLGLCCMALLSTTAVGQILLPGSTTTPAPTPQPAAPAGLITKVTPQQVVQLVSAAITGITITPQIKPGDNGTSVVVFPVWGDQVYSGVALQNCEKDNSGCYVLTFFANFGKQPTINQAWINGWNSNFFQVHAYTLSTGEVVFSSDLMILSGVPPEYITSYASFFKKVVDNSSTYKPSN
jgi:hypothetical protein